MKKITERPVVMALLVAVFILVLCTLVTIPLYDGVFHYDQKLVHFQLEGKVALRQLMGMGLDGLKRNGIAPSQIELKPIGYALLILIHVGLPVLIGVRFAASSANKQRDNG